MGPSPSPTTLASDNEEQLESLPLSRWSPLPFPIRRSTVLAFLCASRAAIAHSRAGHGRRPICSEVYAVVPLAKCSQAYTHTHVAQEGRNRDRPQAKSLDDRNMILKKAKSKKNALYVSSAAFRPSAALPMGWASPLPARRATGPAVHAVPFCECAVQLRGYFPVPSLETPTAGLWCSLAVRELQHASWLSFK